MSDVESEELEDQGPNLGVCISVILSTCCSRVHRAMKAIATNKKKDTDSVNASTNWSVASVKRPPQGFAVFFSAGIGMSYSNL